MNSIKSTALSCLIMLSLALAADQFPLLAACSLLLYMITVWVAEGDA